MAIKLSEVLFGTFGKLRYQPTAKRVRALTGGNAVVDTFHALLVWEPQRITPVFAVPAADLRAELASPEHQAGDVPEFSVKIMLDAPPSLDPRTGFGRHTAPGEELDVVTSAARLPGGFPAG